MRPHKVALHSPVSHHMTDTKTKPHDVVRVNTFPNAKALPLHAAIAKGIFARYGIALEPQFTPNSDEQRDGLAHGKSDIVHSAVDNAIAMIEVAGVDVVIIGGGDSGMNEFIVQADVTSFAAMKGRALAVDAATTAYALLARKILARHGLKGGSDYTVKPVGGGVHRLRAMLADKTLGGAMLNLPFTIQAAKAGMKSLGRATDLLGPYQAGSIFTLRPWAQANGALLERYLAAYIESLRWARDPANKAEAIAMLRDTLKISDDEAQETYPPLLDPDFGFTPDARLDLTGFRAMLDIRAEVEGGKPQAPERYIDLRHYDRAMERLNH
jgi:ABC-type nitrate/sulfonate/bicarbonate transport system substrate-binding protein